LFTKISSNLWQAINHKLFKTKNATDYENHLTIQNNLKVEKRIVISKTSTTLPPEKYAWGTRIGVGMVKVLCKFVCYDAT